MAGLSSRRMRTSTLGEMMSRQSTVIGMLGLLASMAGCGNRPTAWTQPLSISGPYKVGERAMWTDATRGRVFAIDPTTSPPSVGSVKIGRNVTTTQSSPTRKQLLVLTAGREALRKDQVS